MVLSTMTVRAPGEECLTQTQIAQREMMSRVRAGHAVPQDGAEAKTPSSLIKPAEEAKSAASYGSPFSKYLDISV